ncbi:uncharacterized protein NPIL_629821 [Nephila pilipes]|uniref:CUB domain-containing protein n=1 Tax=Nephila pilipes TaxID=299642 RepID=A0A8X6QXB9_NEPPI|nr:uncharacterized protein NPIL_629821 [Nephila pilipes]
MKILIKLCFLVLGILSFTANKTQGYIYIEDICPPDTSNSFEITVDPPNENEISYTEYLKVSRTTSYSPGINCTLKIVGTYDIILNVKQIRFRPNCQDYLQISDGKKRIGLCGTKHERDSNMQFFGNAIYIHFFTNRSTPEPFAFSGFSLIMTISQKSTSGFDCESKTSFRCANDYCIHQRFVCDGINNCGDFSDEIGCDNVDITTQGFPETVVVIAMFLVSIMGLVGGFCMSVCFVAVWTDIARIYLSRRNQPHCFMFCHSNESSTLQTCFSCL